MGWLSNLFGGGGGGDSKGMEWIQKPEYKGVRPWLPSDIGWGSEAITPMAKQYLQQLTERSRGEGLVGFHPEWYKTRKEQGLGDLGEAYREANLKRSEQASGQGLRGGIPLSIQRQGQEDYQDSMKDFLSNLTIADLEAKREDINRATYAQPELANQAAQMQAQRAQFDLNEYDATMPMLYQYPEEENTGGNIFGMLGQLGGLFGGGMGGGKSSSMMPSLSEGYNKSLASGVPAGTQLNPSQLAYQNYLQLQKRA